MTTAAFYLIKSSLFLLAFYLPFIIWLRRNTFFVANRVYLLAGLLLSFLLPLHKGFTVTSNYAAPIMPLVEPFVADTSLIIPQVSEAIQSFEMNTLLIGVYFVGVAVRLVMLALSIKSIWKIRQQSEVTMHQNVVVFRTNEKVPFSFFNAVYLPKMLDDQGILEHELAHVRQRHWIDLVSVELVSIVLWWNPLLIAYRRSIQQQHEYLADQAATGGIDVAEYLVSIKRQIEMSVVPSFISAFYFQSIKNRIDMLTRKRSSVFGVTTYTLVLPVIILLLMAFSPKKKTPVFLGDNPVAVQGEISLGLPIDGQNSFVFESGFGERMHPVLGVKKLHTGIDLTAREGVTVVAAQDGVVVRAQLAEAWGNIIVIRHDDVYSTSYSHLQAMVVKDGDHVKKGQQIGTVGHTGLSQKDHLHFELWQHDKAIDPVQFLPSLK